MINLINYIDSKLLLMYFTYIKKCKPTIQRTTRKRQGYGLEYTPKFLKIKNGRDVFYFGNPFWNIYRITSRVGSEDYVTHRVTN